MLDTGSYVNGKLKIIKMLGSGSFGSVYLAENILTGRKWAIKEVPKSKGPPGTAEYLKEDSIFNELKVLQGVDHPGLAGIADFFEDRDSYYIVSDYVNGVSLDIFLKRHIEAFGSPLHIASVFKIMKQLSDVLVFLDGKGIVHGDIKPSNIMITPDMKAVLVDFGAAAFGAGRRGRNAGSIVYPDAGNNGQEDGTILQFEADSYEVVTATPGYIPEWEEGHIPDISGDIYALGVSMYILASGVHPEKIDSKNKNRKNPKHLPGKSGSRREQKCFLAVINACLDPDCRKRFKNPGELKDALADPEAFLYGRTASRIGKMIPFAALCAAVLVCSGISLYGGHMSIYSRNKAYDQCLAEAAASYGDEAAGYYRTAIMLRPDMDMAYLGLIESVTRDNELSEDDDGIITEAMNAVEYDRSISNEENLKAFEENYLRVAYNLGLAYYYCAGDVQKRSALKYLGYVAEASPDENAGEFAGWKEKSSVLVRMIKYRDIIGLPARNGENEVTFSEYWNDYIELFNDVNKEEKPDISSFWLYKDIASLIFLHGDDFVKDGVTVGEMLNVLDEISERLPSEKTGGIQADLLTDEIKKESGRARMKLRSVEEKMLKEDSV